MCNPSTLKSFGYPVALKRSTVTTPGAPHSASQILAALDWLRNELSTSMSVSLRLGSTSQLGSQAHYPIYLGYLPAVLNLLNQTFNMVYLSKFTDSIEILVDFWVIQKAHSVNVLI